MWIVVSAFVLGIENQSRAVVNNDVIYSRQFIDMNLSSFLLDMCSRVRDIISTGKSRCHQNFKVVE